MSNLDYIEYDAESKNLQIELKTVFMDIENVIDKFDDSRAKTNALNSLEEAYMWLGKAIRDNQLERNRLSVMQEQRSFS